MLPLSRNGRAGGKGWGRQRYGWSSGRFGFGLGFVLWLVLWFSGSLVTHINVVGGNEAIIPVEPGKNPVGIRSIVNL